MRNIFPHLLLRIILAVVIALCPIAFMPARANAQSVSDYYSITYNVQFSATQVTGTNSFSATVTAEATCINDFPLSASQASITGRITARNQGTGATVVLNSGYTLTIDPFPDDTGDSAQVQITVPLQFPAGSTTGTYTITAELISATVTVLVPIDVSGFLSSSQDVGSISYTASGGGGGGSGGSGGTGTTSSSIVGVSGLRSDINLVVYNDGTVRGAVRMQCQEVNAYLDIAKGTKILDRYRRPLETFTAAVADEPPEPAPGTTIAMAVDFGPDGATFSPPITLVMTYDPGTLPEGVLEEELFVAYWDGSEWQSLSGVLDTEANTISVQVSHFTEFAVIGGIPETEESGTETPPASTTETAAEPSDFSISDLSVSPEQTILNQRVTVSAIIANDGAIRGMYAVVLKINGIEKDEKKLILDPGVEYEVSFEIEPESIGDYEVEINGLTGSFSVEEKPVETEEISSGDEVEAVSSGFAFKLWHIIAIVIGIIAVIIGSIVFFVIKRQR
ncbi:hypothetical protein ACFLYN_01285 [Chloroflexota bacterium]